MSMRLRADRPAQRVETILYSVAACTRKTPSVPRTATVSARAPHEARARCDTMPACHTLITGHTRVWLVPTYTRYWYKTFERYNMYRVCTVQSSTVS